MTTQKKKKNGYFTTKKICRLLILSAHENVYAADRLPVSRVSLPCSVVVNLDTSKQKGSHWICIHIDVQKKTEYFDSYGFPPMNHDFVVFMQKNSKVWTFNTRGLQGYFSSVYCKYCIVYLYFKTRHYPLKHFLGLFSIDRTNNDLLIVYLYSRIFLKKKCKRILNLVLLKTPEILPVLTYLLKHLSAKSPCHVSNTYVIG